MEIDWGCVVGFDWDAGNRGKNARKHGVTDQELEEVFLDTPLIVADTAHSGAEPRYHALGRTSRGRELHVTFTMRHGNTRIRIISGRPTNRKERVYHETS
ncbi:MAG: BrnT family toxin [Magnetococcales bacterium]|nr:BrnT family toxin [Magnetococcales bacterium]